MLATPSVAEQELRDIIILFEKLNPSYKRFFENTTERKAVVRLLQDHGKDKLVALLQVLPQIIVRPYAPRITSPYQLDRKMGDLQAFLAQENNKSQKAWTVI